MLYRQGDILIVPLSEVPDLAEAREVGDLVLARGEATGHAHRVAVADPEDARVLDLPDGRKLILATAPVQVVHEEHVAITLAPGAYEVRRQRELTIDEAFRFVVD